MRRRREEDDKLFEAQKEAQSAQKKLGLFAPTEVVEATSPIQEVSLILVLYKRRSVNFDQQL